MAKTNIVNGFPSDYVPQSAKKGREWNLQMQKAIYNDKKSRSVWNGDDQYNRIVNLRRAAGGGKDIDRFKNIVSPDGNSAYLNLNYKQPSIIPTIVKNIVGGLTNQSQRVDVFALNPESRLEHDKEYNKLLAIYQISKQADAIREETGVDIMKGVKKENVFSSEEEISLYMKTNYKQAECIALEDGIRFVNEATDDEELRKLLYEDLVVLSIAGVRVRYDDNGDIQRDYIDPLHLITSYTERPDFKKIKYAGQIKYMEIDDLAATGRFNEAQLKKIGQSVAGKFNNSVWDESWDEQYYPYKNFQIRPWGQFKVKVIDAEYTSTDIVKYEKVPTRGNGFRLVKINKNPKDKNNEVIQKRIKNIYESKWIVGTDYIYDYGLKRDIVRDKNPDGSYSTDVELSFKIYAPDIRDMVNQSLVERIDPIDDEIIIASLKSQALMAQMKPEMFAVDVISAAAAAAALGIKNITPRDLDDIASSTGTYYYASRTEDGRPVNNGQPAVRELPSGMSNKLASLLEVVRFNLQKVEYFTGVPMSTIASPDKDALVGIEKMKSLVRTTSLRYIQDAFENIYGRASKEVAIMIQDSISNGGKLEDYGMAIGYTEANILNIKKQIGLMRIGVGIRITPDASEIQALQEQINYALQNGLIRPSDALKVRRFAQEGSIEKAELWLETYERQYEREKLQQSTAASTAQAQAQAEGALAIEQAKAQTKQLEAQLKLQELKLEKALESKQSTQDFVEEMKLQMQRLQGDLEKIRVASEQAQEAEKKADSSEKIQGAFPKATGMRQPKVPAPAQV